MKVERAGTEVQVTLPGSYNTFTFTMDCGREWVAALVVKDVRETFQKAVSESRQNEYLAGYSDAKKRNTKRTWFRGFLGGS